MASCIITERLVLRPIRAADAQALMMGIGDLEVARWLTSPPHPYALCDAKDFIARNGNNFPQVAAIEEEGLLAGVVGVKRELGYWLGREFWGRGIALEAARAMVDCFFASPENDLLLAGYFEGNHRSARVLGKLGFTRTWRERVMPKATGVELWCHKMQLTRDDWSKT